jgi:hypothetical protein
MPARWTPLHIVNYESIARLANEVLRGQPVTIETLVTRIKYREYSHLGSDPSVRESMIVQTIQATESNLWRGIDLVTKTDRLRVATVYDTKKQEKVTAQYSIDAGLGRVQFHSPVDGYDTIIVISRS